jgi:hypothetical protein
MSDYIANNYQVISVCFGSLAAIFVLLRVSLLGLKSLVSYIESNQRMQYQAEFFDRNHQEKIDDRAFYNSELKEIKSEINAIKLKYATDKCESINNECKI